MFNRNGGENLGTAYAYVELDTRGIERGVQQAQRQFQTGVSQIGVHISRLGDQMTAVGANITKMTAPWTVFAATGIQTAMDFDSAIAMIGARTGLVGESLENIADIAIREGARTVFSSQQVADAFLQMLTAGLSTEQAIAALPAVLDGAAAANLDLGLTADYATNIMSVFGLEATDTAQIVDILTRAAASSPASFQEFSEALQVGGGIAQQFGLDLEQTSAIFGIFAQNGIRGSEAGTQLRSMLIAMSANTEAASSAWDALGTSLYNADGTMRDLDDVFADIRVGLANLSPEKQNEVIKTLAGSYGLVGFNAILASEGIEGFTDTMDGQTSATDVAAAQMETFQQKVNSLMGSFQTLQIAVLTPFMNKVLKPLVEQAIVIVNQVTAWAQANEDLVMKLATVLTVVAALGAALIPLGMFVGALGAAFAALTSVTVALPLAALAAGAALVYRHFDDLSVIAIQLKDSLQAGIGRVLEKLAPLFAEIGAFIGNLFGGIDTGKAAGMAKALFNLFNPIGRIFELLKATGIDFGKIFDDIVGALTGFFGALNDGEGVFDALRLAFGDSAIIDTIQQAFLGLSLFISAYVVPALQEFGRWFTEDALPGIVDFVTTQVVPVVQGFFQFLADAWNFVAPALMEFGRWFLEDILPQVVAIVRDTLWPLLQSVFQFIADAWAIISPTLVKIADWFLYTALPEIQRFISETVMPVLAGLFNFIAGVWETISPALLSILDWFTVTALPAIVGFINETVMPVVSGFIGILQSIWEVVGPGLSAIWAWFTQTALPAVVNFMETVVMPIVEGFVNVLSTIWSVVSVPLNAFKDGIEAVFGWIVDNVIGPIVGGLQSIVEWAGQALRDLGLVQDQGNPVESGQALDAIKENRPDQIFSGTRDSGGPGLAGRAYLIGKGAQPEAFVPSTNGQFIPNIDQLLTGMQDREPVHVGQVFINANSEAEGRAAARGFEQQLEEARRARG